MKLGYDSKGCSGDALITNWISLDSIAGVSDFGECFENGIYYTQKSSVMVAMQQLSITMIRVVPIYMMMIWVLFLSLRKVSASRRVTTIIIMAVIAT